MHIIAHRGRSEADHPDNTLTAFTAALDEGADMVECDVRRLADGELVCFHDAAIAGQPLSSLSHSELESLAGFAVPRLDELAQLCRECDAGLDLELKERDCAVDALSVVNGLAELWVKSFHDDIVREVLAAQPDVHAGLLLGVPRGGLRLRFSEFFPVRRLRSCGARFVAPNWRLLRLSFLRRMQRSGFPVLVWTVNDFRKAQQLAAAGVAGIATDRPRELRSALEPRA
ncbi:MAG: glycerophosphodiester phosphodiesterase [Candidatus Poseidoniia archaeon]|nr:glycerophosphodiester phosphodiesterase [Euryarchaeota archaeon]MDP6489665.1 glycerophosphodiester phosphodiesterase [Candidatus Poseidoniia archaeon]MDP6534340.1 glycerophosphodiester phosphodiesterase [Candidatus Poseidoniia archaeon]MDP6834664.1 glycerophosphodiester phosphodiesterase [Candidatus Poseidoniia archaeon]HIH79403.1 glycerophosphodiester phosphodiesterase [Candidatus Poseidoniia archaeon]